MFGRAVAFGKNQELVAPVAERHVAARQLLRQAHGQSLQQLVADRVAQRVVDDLEVVQIEQHQRKAFTALANAIDHALDLRIRRVPVRQAGHRVDIGQLVELLLRRIHLATDARHQQVGQTKRRQSHNNADADECGHALVQVIQARDNDDLSNLEALMAHRLGDAQL